MTEVTSINHERSPGHAIGDPAAAPSVLGYDSGPQGGVPALSGKSVTAAVFAVVLIGVQAVVQTESWTGLTGFARLIHITGAATQGVPITLDGVSTVSALLALRAELNDEASGRERMALYLFTLASCAANYWHGMHSGGIEGALYFGGMSLAVTFVFDMLLRQIRRSIQRRKGRRSTHVPQFGLTHWLRYPSLTYTAWSLAIKDGHETSAEAFEAARQAIDGSQYPDLPELPIDHTTLAGMTAPARLAVAFGAIGKTDVPAALALLRKHGTPIDSSHAYKVRAAMLEGGQP